MQIVIKATTPEETKNQIAKYLNMEAGGYRNSARLMTRKSKIKEANIKAQVLDWVATIVKNMRIE